ncbi:Ser/Thr protein kinase RdoA (MazF antagonist) [Salirhabdus euzebyi]|uniref:Ser/Thr protein kinase RdoA (MazF antagonist) n=1 Tax=Salirhabdus euzebyi TaxID=394506 RepID=A0A841Q4M0_9BACI|nr:phosphotransferase [Salirhabdus euzebyi]MBB6453344.1 Ser/Thr protein kinase RdoA (MazF antagonist) [Salirhabdus euzebyi]
MMKLSTMKKVVATVDHNWRSPLAEQILDRWGYDEGSVYYIRASANFIFVCKQNGKVRFLRFNDLSERDFQTTQSELNILHYLKSKQVKAAQPILSKTNNYMEVVETEIGTFCAVLFEGFTGKQLEVEELNEKDYFIWGKALGQLHQAFKDAPVELKTARSNWKEQLLKVKKMLPKEETEALQELELIQTWADLLPITSDNFGLIHYDFELDNLRWENNEIGMIDFDESANYWFVADIAFALRDLLDRGITLDDPLMATFIKGYETELTVDMALLKDLQLFSRMHQLIQFSRLLRTLDIKEAGDQPDWLAPLTKKLQQKVEAYRNSLIGK